MKAGILREKIELYKPVAVKTDFGNTKIEYQFYKDTRCHVQHNAGNKQDSNNEIFYSNSKNFIVRHYVDVQENMRVKYEGKFYSIESITPNKFYNDKEIYATLTNV